MRENRLFQSYPYHMKFEMLANEHPEYEIWLHNHYMQLVFDSEEGALDFVTIKPERCLLIERMEQMAELLEKDGINLCDYIRYYLAKGYRLSRMSEIRGKKTEIGSVDDIWLWSWLEAEHQFGGLRYLGQAEWEPCYVREDELLHLISGWECRFVFEKVRAALTCTLDEDKVRKNIECYITSRPLPGPDQYYRNQKEGTSYGIEAVFEFVAYYQENMLGDDEKKREKVRASLWVLIEHKELMRKRLEALQKQEVYVSSDDIIQAYRIMHDELYEIVNVLFGHQGKQWNGKERRLLHKIRELTIKEQEHLVKLHGIVRR